MRSARPSTWARSSLPAANARRANSPGWAGRNPASAPSASIPAGPLPVEGAKMVSRGALFFGTGRHQQALDALAAHHVALQDLVHIGAVAGCVPGALGVDDDARPELAAVEAAGDVDAHIPEA